MVNAIQKELEVFFLSGENSYLDYVGGSESGKGVLMTEPSCKTITIDGSAHCYGKNFSYRIWSSEYGYFLAFQRRSEPGGEDLYAVLIYKKYDNLDRGWRIDCMAHSDLGYKICSDMVAHGWELGDERY